jgi:hypothetical protein
MRHSFCSVLPETGSPLRAELRAVTKVYPARSGAVTALREGVLRLSGATRPQVLRMLATEAGLITFGGTALAAVVTAVTVLSVHGGLAGLAPSVPYAIPWRVAGSIAAGCLLIALAATLLPAAAALRRRPAPFAGLT